MKSYWLPNLHFDYLTNIIHNFIFWEVNRMFVTDWALINYLKEIILMYKQNKCK